MSGWPGRAGGGQPLARGGAQHRPHLHTQGGHAGHSYHSLSTLCDQIIVIGDAGVGKTSLIHQLTKKEFNEVVMPTLGVDFSAKNLPSVLDNTTIRLHLWDLAGLL